MATQADVRRIALSLPETEETENHFAFSVRNKGKLKGFVWVWMERITPKKARVPQDSDMDLTSAVSARCFGVEMPVSWDPGPSAPGSAMPR